MIFLIDKKKLERREKEREINLKKMINIKASLNV